MFMRQFLTKNRKAEADGSTLPGRDSVRQPENTLTDTLGVAEASSSTTNYSKRPSAVFLTPILICVNFVSLLSDLL